MNEGIFRYNDVRYRDRGIDLGMGSSEAPTKGEDAAVGIGGKGVWK